MKRMLIQLLVFIWKTQRNMISYNRYLVSETTKEKATLETFDLLLIIQHTSAIL